MAPFTTPVRSVLTGNLFALPLPIFAAPKQPFVPKSDKKDAYVPPNSETKAKSGGEKKSRFKDRNELQQALTDEKLFGDAYETYKKDSEKKPEKGQKIAVKKYGKVTKALDVVRAYSKGEKGYLDIAKDNIVEWLNTDELRSNEPDPTAHKARVALIEALESAPVTEDVDWNAGIEALVKTLRGKYPTTPVEEKKPEKPVDKKPEEKKPTGPETPKEDAPKQDAGVALKDISFSFSASSASGRKDNFDAVKKKVKSILASTHADLVKKFPGVSLQGKMLFTIDNKSGQVTRVQFVDLKAGGKANVESVVNWMSTTSSKINGQVSYEKSKSDAAFVVTWPINLVP